jgi:hypothetical protein
MQGTAQECFPMSQLLLFWIDAQISIVAREAKGTFSVQPEDELFGPSGKKHTKYKTFADYKNELLFRSTGILFPLAPAATVLRTFPVPYSVSDGSVAGGPAWPHTHTLDVENDDVHVDTGKGACRINSVTINGYLQWQRGGEPLYYIMNEIPGGEAFAGALIAPGKREGQMTALVFSPKTREIGIHFVQLEEKHLNCIRGLALAQPNS